MSFNAQPYNKSESISPKKMSPKKSYRHSIEATKLEPIEEKQKADRQPTSDGVTIQKDPAGGAAEGGAPAAGKTIA